MGMSKVHKQAYLKLNAVDDGEPVQLPQYRPDVKKAPKRSEQRRFEYAV